MVATNFKYTSKSQLNSTRNHTIKERKRAGIIPMTRKDEKYWFLLGIEYISREYTDFGGALHKGETFIQGALREFEEETCGIITLSSNLADTLVIQNDHCQVYFPMVSNDLLTGISDRFKRAQAKVPKAVKKCYEIVNIAWVDFDTFTKMIYDPNDKRMWSILKTFLRNNSNKDQLLGDIRGHAVP